MRVITGTAKGLRLLTPEGQDVRPTPDRVKEGVFSAIQFELEGRRMLDLFAGSGQMGIEALSRGALSATFVDSKPQSIKLVEENLKNTGLSDKAKVVKKDFQSFIATDNGVYDIVFIDPPYAAGLFVPAIEKVQGLVSDYGVIICEHPIDVNLPETVGTFTTSKQYRYGKVCITLFRKEGTV